MKVGIVIQFSILREDTSHPTPYMTMHLMYGYYSPISPVEKQVAMSIGKTIESESDLNEAYMNKSKQAAKKMLYFLYQILDAVLINKYTITKIVTKSSFQILPSEI